LLNFFIGVFINQLMLNSPDEILIKFY